jgi:hypothetical protein
MTMGVPGDRRLVGVLRGVFGAVAVMTAVTGCTGSSSPAPVPVTSTVTVDPPSTTSPSASATVTAPVLPAAARQPTRAGAEAFFRYFWEVYNYSYRTRDISVFRTLYKDSCRFCSTSVADIEAATAKNLHYTGGEVAIQVLVAAPDNPETGMLVNSVIRQEQSQLLRSDGTAEASEPGVGRQRLDALLQWQGGRWHMLGVDAAEEPSP